MQKKGSYSLTIPKNKLRKILVFKNKLKNDEKIRLFDRLLPSSSPVKDA